MKGLNKEGTLYTIIFTFLVSFVFVILLALTNEGTEHLVERNRELSRQRAVLSAMGLEFTDDEEVRELYRGVEQIERGGAVLYRTIQDGRTIYAKEFAGSGLWGTINGVLGVNSGADTITGLEIISHNETPGLGGRIDEPEFKSQFEGERVTGNTIEVQIATGEEDPDDGVVNAITGATRTSEAIEKIINTQLQAIRAALEDENG
jgi:Na+-transporting NADH:ubiquinone oxidoreductase subunit C